MRELAHRGKNLVSVIQAIASRTLRGDSSIDSAREVFIARLNALARSYNTLTDETPESSDLHHLLTESLQTLGDRVHFAGPRVMIPAKKAQTISLLLHELATNAAKYGALSTDRGRISAVWQLSEADGGEERFIFAWTESGGPPIGVPERKGFGSVILTSIVGKEFDCQPSMQYLPSGLEYRLECLAAKLCDASP
jgi:two-component sensor histidine kinase